MRILPAALVAAFFVSPATGSSHLWPAWGSSEKAGRRFQGSPCRTWIGR